MDNLSRIYGLRPPRFDTKKSNVLKFFSRFEKFVAQQPDWHDLHKVRYLANL